MAGTWTSLEIAKLAVALSTPALVAIVGWQINKRLKLIEDRQWTGRKVTERRLQLYEEMAPDLNKLLCFFNFKGDFRAMTPPQAIGLKRSLDGQFHVYRFLMDEAFAQAYNAFIDGCFRRAPVAGKDALIRSNVATQRSERGPGHWDDQWSGLFTDAEEATPQDTIRSDYDYLMKVFARNVGLA